MKRLSGSVLGAVVVALAACAGEDDPPNSLAENEADASTIVGDVSDAATDATQSLRDADAGATPPECSPAGWCTTRLPGDTAFTFTDIWPLEKKAFATGSPKDQPLHGTIAEYDGDKWQILSPLYNAKVVWSPGEDEVWAGGESYLGMAPLERGIRTAGGWTWTPMFPEATSVVDLWGAGPNDVYVLASEDRGTHVYHLDAAGTSSLVLDPDATFGVTIDRVVGTSVNDVWIVGHRDWCAFLAHKRDGAFVTLADGTPQSSHLGAWTCQAKASLVA